MKIGRKTKYGTVPAVTIAIAIVVMLTIGPILSSKAADATFQLITRGDIVAPVEVGIAFSGEHIATTSQSAVKMTLTNNADVSPLDIARAVVVGTLADQMLNRPNTVLYTGGASNPLSAAGVTDLNSIASLSVKVFATAQTAGSGGLTPSFEIVMQESDGSPVQIAVQVCPMNGGGLGDCSQTDMYINGNSLSGRATATSNLNAFGTMSPAATTTFAGSRWEMFDVNAVLTGETPSNIHPDDGKVNTLAQWKTGGGTVTSPIGGLTVTSIAVLFHYGNPAGIPSATDTVWIDDIAINGVIFHPQSAASFGGESTASYTPRTTPSATSSSTD